ncbi:MAG: hypothetical protein ACFCUS_07650 [Rubrimonas sp.]|uniref:hypothetical protein n=1 Tax=Rubrimonas sp. TaxID=2036015 RepID=UPI002FDE52DB
MTQPRREAPSTTSLRRRAAGAVRALLIGALLAPAAALAQFAGDWRGLGAADGMRMRIDGGGDALRGRFTDVDGAVREFRATRAGDVAEAEVPVEGGRVFLRIRPRGAGLEVALVPLADDGTLDAGAARALAFVPAGTRVPDSPRWYMPPPASPPRAIDPMGFAASYAFWEPDAVAWGYAALAPRYRTVMRLFPLVQADLLWKLCAASQRPAALGEALRGQGVTCADVANAVEAMQRAGKFERYKDAVAREHGVLMRTLDCADDATRTRRDCADAAAETAKRATSMETVATALARLR